MPNIYADVEPQAVSTGAATALDRLVDTFTDAWQTGKRPAIDSYLPADESLRRIVLIKLIHIDLEHRLEIDEPARVETYLEQYPEIGSDAPTVIELAAWEFTLRRRRESDLTADEYRRRLPLHGDLIGPDFAARFSELMTAAERPTSPRTGPLPSAGFAPSAVDIPGYEMAGILGHGGMGMVYKARHVALDRFVALKTIRPGGDSGHDHARRFEHEMKAAGRLRHPNIVPIYEVGHAVQPFYTMPFFSGGNLAESRSRYTGNQEAVLTLMEKIARAIHHAHEQGVLHRDLKPANVLLDENGEPQVTDFGLAKLSDSLTDLTQTGTLLGTAAYMSPEQANCRSRDVGPHTDVWTLGVMLYELLLGRRPFLGENSEEVRHNVLTQDPPAPRKLKPDLDPGLEAVILSCLEKDPARRCPSALLLAENLGNCRRNEAPRLWKMPWRTRARRTARRYRSIAAVALGLAFVLAALFFVRDHNDPERVYREIERKSQIGSVTLIGKVGPPAWSRWSLGDAVAKVSSEADEPFSITTTMQSRLDLLKKAPAPRYRFSAEIKHDLAIDTLSLVGIYFAQNSVGDNEERTRYWCNLLFADVGNTALQFSGPDPKFRYSQVSLSRDRLHLPDLLHNHMGTTAQDFFVSAAAVGGARWRKLMVEVTPNRIQASWENRILKPLSPAVLDQGIPSVANGAPVTRDFKFAPDGGLGLYVEGGRASFRNVIVERLD